jgi:hypothetical protein
MFVDVAYRLQDQILKGYKAVSEPVLNPQILNPSRLPGIAMLNVRNVAFIIVLLSLSACQTVGERAPSYVPTLTFTQYESLPLDVGQIDIRSRYKPASHNGNVANLFPTTPENALTRYLHQRYRAQKEYRTKLDMIVRDAHAKRETIGENSGVMSVINMKGRERYTVFIELALAHRTAEDQLIRRAVLNFRKGFIVPIKLSLAERERRMNSFIQSFIKDIDTNLQNSLSESLYILPAKQRTNLRKQDKGLMPGVPLKR